MDPEGAGTTATHRDGYVPERKFIVLPTGVSAPYVFRALQETKESARRGEDLRDRLKWLGRRLVERAEALEKEARDLRQLADDLDDRTAQAADLVVSAQDIRDWLESATR